MTEPAAGKFLLRPMGHADLELVLSWRNHPTVRSYMCTQHEIKLKEHLNWFDKASADPSKHLRIFEPDGEPLGFVSFSELAAGGIADWGFYTSPRAPKGSGRELGRAALDCAFLQLKFHKICGQVFAGNERSVRLHQTLGFKQEGVLREQYFDSKRYHDVICFGFLFQEWKSRF
jgi:UDP-4-amino-4,6-dideoxy-N-acetyl-beta-L-altrosamine N-acetyltransferase